MKEPHIITASRTRDGRPIYWHGARLWSEDSQGAVVYANKQLAMADVPLARTTEFEACDPYAMLVEIEGGMPKTASLRERIRAGGPTAVLEAMGYVPASAQTEG